LINVVVPVAAGIVTYGVAARLLGLSELDQFLETVTTRLKRVLA
jgi:hypothetical protein